MPDNRRIQAGSGVYTCTSCGKPMRETGLEESTVEMCAECYEINLLDNEYSDGRKTEEEFNRKVEEIKFKYSKNAGRNE